MSGQNETLPRKEGTFIEGLAEKLGVTANVKFIYGDPVERDGVTVIPVGKLGYGFGGGGGKKEKEEGAGGAGGLGIMPVGYIEMKNGETRFRHTRDLLPAILCAAPLVLLTVLKIAKLFRNKEAK